jgi:hypothetical protein
MEFPVSPHRVALLILGTIAPLSAQDLASSLLTSDSRHIAEQAAWTGPYEVPATPKAEANPGGGNPVFTSVDAFTLTASESVSRDVESVIDLGVLRQPSPYHHRMVSTGGTPYEVSTRSLQASLAAISALYRESGKPEKSPGCQTISLAVEQAIKLDPSRILEIIELEITANPGCACEIVKTAIKTSEADADQVVTIVDVAIHAAPESMRLISQCAIAANPDAVTGVQALLAMLDPGAGDGVTKSAKSAKDAKDAKAAIASKPPLPNPLDLPPLYPLFYPLPIIPPVVTEVNPCPPSL